MTSTTPSGDGGAGTTADAADGATVAIDGDRAGEVFGALSSATARTILARLYEAPLTPSEVADEADTSLQNAKHHLDQLSDADLIEVVETTDSDFGQEMRRYGPTNDAVVLSAGDPDVVRSDASGGRNGPGSGEGGGPDLHETSPDVPIRGLLGARARWILVGALLSVLAVALARLVARD